MRWVVGGLLVSAAFLKAVELATKPATTLAIPLGGLLLPVQVGAELGIGLLALSGLYWQKLRWIALLLFSSFAAYSFYLAMGRAASCGCFGPLRIHPWWTFSLDLAVILGLLFSVRYGQLRRLGPESSAMHTVPYRSGRRQLVAVCTGATVVAFAVLVRHADRRTAAAEGPAFHGR